MAPNIISSSFNRRTALMASTSLLLLNHVPAYALQSATPNASDLEEVLRELEFTRLRSLVDFDKEVAVSLHADNFQLINPSGVALSKGEYLGDLETGFVNYSIFEPVSEIIVHLSPGSAILRYQSDLALTLNGTEIPLSNYWHTDYYEERDNGWQVVWSQATEILV